MVVVPRGAVREDGAAVRAARKLGAGVAEVWWDGEGLRVEVVEKGERGVGREVGGVEVEVAREGDVALVLHTSGTTGRPKAVGALIYVVVD